jgi:hypothetical protein
MSDVFEHWHPLSRTMRVLVLVTFLALVGCAAPVPASDAVAYQCQRDMRATRAPLPGLLDLIDDQQFYNQCVRARMGATQP